MAVTWPCVCTRVCMRRYTVAVWRMCGVYAFVVYGVWCMCMCGVCAVYARCVYGVWAAGKDEIGQTRFCDCIFELADVSPRGSHYARSPHCICALSSVQRVPCVGGLPPCVQVWTRTLAVEEYSTFLQKLLDTIAQPAGSSLYFWREESEVVWGGYVADGEGEDDTTSPPRRAPHARTDLATAPPRRWSMRPCCVRDHKGKAELLSCIVTGAGPADRIGAAGHDAGRL